MTVFTKLVIPETVLYIKIVTIFLKSVIQRTLQAFRVKSPKFYENYVFMANIRFWFIEQFVPRFHYFISLLLILIMQVLCNAFFQPERTETAFRHHIEK